jgi:hypothetical protein
MAYLLINKTEEKCRTGSAWKGGGVGERVGAVAGGRNDPTMYAYVNK